MALLNPEPWLVSCVGTAPDAQTRDVFSQFRDLYNRRLWHQLTEALWAYVNPPSGARPGGLLDLYTNFICAFETKMNQLQLARLLVLVAGQAGSLADALAFLEAKAQAQKEAEERVGKESVTKDVPQARVLLQCEAALLLLRQGRREDVKAVMEATGEFLAATLGVDSTVHSAHYKLQLNYFKEVGPAEEYYRSSLLYLSYTPLDTIAEADQCVLAFDLCLAALVGESIYVFGDLLTQKIVATLEADGARSWVVRLLRALNAGDIVAFKEILDDHAADANAQPALVRNRELLLQKISILALVDMLFRRALTERNVEFGMIAKAAHLRLEEVEVLLMKTLSLKLIRGTIDQIDQRVFVTWVHPRILNLDQVSSLRDRLKEWNVQVMDTYNILEKETSEIVA